MKYILRNGMPVIVHVDHDATVDEVDAVVNAAIDEWQADAAEVALRCDRGICAYYLMRAARPRGTYGDRRRRENSNDN